MTYEDFKKEFIKILKENKSSDAANLLDDMAEAAWMAFGRLNVQNQKDSWGRDTRNPL